MSEEAPLHPLPPFTVATAHAKVKAAQNKWNTKDAAAVSLAYTPDSVWRNRDQFVVGREEIKEFLACKWRNEHNYRLRKEVFAFSGNKIAVEFWYEHSETPDPTSQWYRTYGLEHWVFADDGRMKSRQMSGNTMPIEASERWFAGPDPEVVNAGTVPLGHISFAG